MRQYIYSIHKKDITTSAWPFLLQSHNQIILDTLILLKNAFEAFIAISLEFSSSGYTLLRSGHKKDFVKKEFQHPHF